MKPIIYSICIALTLFAQSAYADLIPDAVFFVELDVNLGSALGISGNHFVVGDSSNKQIDEDAGAAFLFDISNPTAAGIRLNAPGIGYQTHFGRRIAVEGNLAIVSGSSIELAHIFDLTDPTLTAIKLNSSVNKPPEFFVDSISINGTKALVGAARVDNRKGAIYLYDLSDLSIAPIKLVAPDGEDGDIFGARIDTSDNIAVISAPNDDNGTGAVYVFDLNDLNTAPVKLTAPDATEGDGFGSSVVIDSNQIVVGAIEVDDQGPETGAAYLFNLSDLSSPGVKITAPDATAGDFFGNSIAIGNNKIFVGSVGNKNEQGGAGGAVYVFDAMAPTTLEMKLLEPDPGILNPDLNRGENFGSRVAFDNNNLVIRANGVIYLYQIPEPGTISLLIFSIISIALFQGRQMIGIK